VVAVSLDNEALVPYWHTRPTFLLEKSNAELEHLTKVVMLTVTPH
jgi:hypothetical protein